MIISDVQVREVEGTLELSARVSVQGARRDFRPWYRYSGVDSIEPWGDAFLALFLIPCMYSSEDLRIEAPVSARLLASVPQIQKIIRSWFKDFAEIEVSASETHGRRFQTENPGTASLFSGGVDSWYSVLKHRAEITHLLLIHGFDIKQVEVDLWQRTKAILDKASRELGMRPITVMTNSKRFADVSKEACPWGRRFDGRFWRIAHGSGIASTALGLQGSLERLYFPSSAHPPLLFPFGSHPQLDPLWSTDNLEIIHDGGEHNRTGKIRAQLLGSPLALENLRVCLDNEPGKYNCCRCEKCLRTMASLRICGLRKKTRTFPESLDLGRIRRLYIPPDIHYPFYVELMNEALAAKDHELADAVRTALGGNGFSLDHAIAHARQHLGKALLSVAPRGMAPSLKWLTGSVCRELIPESTHLVKRLR